MNTPDHILASAMEKLAESIVSEDGIANAAIREAGQRITELSEELASETRWAAQYKAERDSAALSESDMVERISHAEIILGELASGYWRSALNGSDPTGQANMGERVIAYWERCSGDVPKAGFREALTALMPFVLRDFVPGTTTRAHREAVENACHLLGIKPEAGGGL